MHQEKVQEGIYTALEICDEFYTESNLMLQLIFFLQLRTESLLKYYLPIENANSHFELSA